MLIDENVFATAASTDTTTKEQRRPQRQSEENCGEIEDNTAKLPSIMET